MNFNVDTQCVRDKTLLRSLLYLDSHFLASVFGLMFDV